MNEYKFLNHNGGGCDYVFIYVKAYNEVEAWKKARKRNCRTFLELREIKEI